MSKEDILISQKVEAFKEKGKSGLKSGETTSIDSAIWYLEVTANYTYSDGSYDIDSTTTDSTFITLQINNGRANLNEAYTKYEVMIDRIRSYYQSIYLNEKQLITVNVEPSEITANQLICKAIYTFAVGSFTGPLCSFNSMDGWKPIGAGWNNGGICLGQNSGLYPDRDLATEIQRKIMLCKGVPSGNVYYDPIVELEFYGYDWPDPNFNGGNQNINYTSHYIYYNIDGFPGYMDCVPADDCNYYLNGTKHVLYTSETAADPGLRPDGMSFILLHNFIGDIALSIPGFAFHTGKAQYGIMHISPNPPEDLD